MLCPEPSLWNSIAGLVNHLNWSLGRAVPAYFMVSLNSPVFEQCILTSYWNKEAVFVNKMLICTILGPFATNKAFPFSIERNRLPGKKYHLAVFLEPCFKEKFEATLVQCAGINHQKRDSHKQSNPNQ